MPRPSTLALALAHATCFQKRHRIYVTQGGATPYFMPPCAKVELGSALWYPAIAAIDDNAGVREDEDGLYWVTQSAALSALAAAQKKLSVAT